MYKGKPLSQPYESGLFYWISQGSGNEEMNVFDALSRHKPFKDLPKSERSAIARTFRRADYPTGSRTLEQHGKMERLGLVLNGAADLVIQSRGGKEFVFDSLRPGDFFGRMTPRDNDSPNFILLSRLPMTCFFQNEANRRGMVSAYPSIKEYLMDIAINRLCKACKALNGTAVQNHPRQCNLDKIPRIIRKPLQYIDRNYMQPLVLDEVAREGGISKYHLSRMFKAKVGCSFKDYLNRRRTEAAKILMTQEEMNVSEACFAVGFNDLSYFSRVFRKIEGIPPSEYRRKAGK